MREQSRNTDEIKFLLERIERLERQSSMQRAYSFPQQVRLAKTVENPDISEPKYPASGNTFPFVFIEGDFPGSPGEQTAVYTVLDSGSPPTPHGHCHNITGEYIPEGTIVRITKHVGVDQDVGDGEWWIERVGGSPMRSYVTLSHTATTVGSYSNLLNGTNSSARYFYHTTNQDDADAGVEWVGSSDPATDGTFILQPGLYSITIRFHVSCYYGDALRLDPTEAMTYDGVTEYDVAFSHTHPMNDLFNKDVFGDFVRLNLIDDEANPDIVLSHDQHLCSGDDWSHTHSVHVKSVTYIVEHATEKTHKLSIALGNSSDHTGSDYAGNASVWFWAPGGGNRGGFMVDNFTVSVLKLA